MEVLAGDENFEVIHNEGSCSFQFDIRKVYWCSRLQNERDRMLKKLKKDEVLCDAFCGVGPLAIRAAKAGYKVIANDLNPDCFIYLNLNAKRNKISSKVLTSYNMDARDFIRLVISSSKDSFPRINHIYMNLPKDALEFLDVFIGLFTDITTYTKETLPTVHVYGFSNAKDPKEDLIGRVANAFNIQSLNKEYLTDFHDVRDVSNNKHMFCLSIKIPPEIAYK
jgi:tRNA (guanine37-N1)-methyltransferase